MATLSDYVSGTISLTNGEVEFTGTGTAWLLAQIKEGDTILDLPGTPYQGVIASITSNTAGTLTKAWEGPDLVDVAYRIRILADGSRSTASAVQLREQLGNGNVQALAGLSGSANKVPMFTAPGAMTLVPKTDLVSGANYDVQVANLTARAAYNGMAEGFSVLVSNTGDGRSAIYSKVSNTSGDWSSPAYVTGPAVTLDVTEVDDVPYGTPPDVMLTPVAGGYNMLWKVPLGMIVVPGTITTLPSDQPAQWDWEPIEGGFRVHLSIPRGPTGDINGVTPFWVSRLGADADAAAALTGLGLTPFWQSRITNDTDAATARSAIGASPAAGLTPQGRLSAVAGVALPEMGAAGATALHYLPATGAFVPVFNGTEFRVQSIGDGLTVDLSTQPVSYNFDVYVIMVAGVPRLAIGMVWQDAFGGTHTQRGTGAGSAELERLEGILVNKYQQTMRYSPTQTVIVPARHGTFVGTFRPLATGTVTDTALNRLLSNAYNTAPRHLLGPVPSDTGYDYAAAAYRPVNGEAGQMVQILNCLPGRMAQARAALLVGTPNTNTRNCYVGIGVDSMTASSAQTRTLAQVNNLLPGTPTAEYRGFPGLGWHYLSFLEMGSGAGSQLWTTWDCRLQGECIN